MGNTGSASHSNIDGIGELRQHTHLQRQTVKKQFYTDNGEQSKCYSNGARNWTKSLPHVYPTEANEREVFKVLPEVNEHPKLRTTTNGAILHSGGTISGRKEVRKAEGLQKVLPAMQRSHTFIYETGRDDASQTATRPTFRRAQTLLHLKENSHDIGPSRIRQNSIYKSQLEPKPSSNMAVAYSEPDLRLDISNKAGASLPAEVAKDEALSLNNGKKNKYNKKRKAPPAPGVTTTFGSNRPSTQMQVPVGAKDSLRTPRFRTLQQQKKQSPKEPHASPIPRQAEEKLKNSPVEKEKLQAFPKNSPVEKEKLQAFRREKSFDVLLLRNNHDEPSNICKKQSTDYGVRTPITHAATTKPASKIPQLKRTFYFGMNSSAEITRKQELDQNRPQKLILSMDAGKGTLSPSMDFIGGIDGGSGDKSPKAKVDDSGLLVNVRPTLPRRQLETPSFSPTVAWRMLVAEQQSLHPQRSCPKPLNSKFISRKTTRESLSLDNISGDSGIFADNGKELEPPIQLSAKIATESPLRTHTSVWIPQQDLDEDDDADKDEGDEDDNEDVFLTVGNDESSNELDNGTLLFGGHKVVTTKRLGKSDNNRNSSGSAGVHLFSLSLPRDTHVQSTLKLKANMYNDKLPGFSSLQKLKSNVLNSKCSCLDSKGNALHFTPGNSLTHCAVHDGADSYYRSDNWVLHKNKIHQGTGTAACGKTDSDVHSKWDVLSPIEPISLTYLAGGRHVMYLPGTDHTHFPSAEDRIKPKTTRKSTKPPSGNMRESLQDKSPIVAPNNVYGHSVSPSNMDLAMSNEKTQRFTFQSTVRLLEKRRLAEKLSKDAEMREAQRKNEMEAMKRVEEDFQRKRAFEKANIRHQLRLYFNESLGDADGNFEHNSLPVMSHEKSDVRDNNNNMFCRADPDGAVSTPSPLFPEGEAATLAFERRLPLRSDSDFAESDVDADDLTNFKCTASLVEPYLQSIIH